MKTNSRMKSAKKPNCRRDEDVPLVAVVQAEATNHPLGFCEDSSLRDSSSRSPAGSKGRSPSRSKLFSPAGAGVGFGENRVQALLWNVGTCHPDAERCKWEPHKYLRTKAGNRDSAPRSSEESPVMGLERRGCPIRLRKQPETGGLS